jgi:hypothetical protein
MSTISLLPSQNRKAGSLQKGGIRGRLLAEKGNRAGAGAISLLHGF